MTRDDYRKAAGSFEPDASLKQRIASTMEQPPRRSVRPLRRALVGTLAAVLALVSLTGIAMAASPEIRQAVLRFFHIDEVERVPSGATPLGGEALTGTEIGDRVTAWYIDMDFDGVYFPEKVRLNDDGSVDAFIDWVIDGDTLSAYEYAPEKVSFSVTWRGAEYSGDVYYCVHDGELMTYCDGYDFATDHSYYVNIIPDRTDAVLLYVSRGSQADYEQYPFLLQLETGEVEDFLAGTGVDGLELANNYSFSPGNRQLFVTCGDVLLGTRQCWYFDFDSGALIDAKNLAGEEINTGWFAPDGTLLLYKGDGENNTVIYWAYDTGTGKTTLTLDRARVIRDIEEDSSGGAIIAGNYAVYVDSERHAEVIDLTTGERRPVEGFAFNDGDSFMANSAGTKLVYYNYEDGWTSLGVLDLISGGFVSFDREPAEGVSEDILSWYDDECIQIGGTAADGGAVFYLYDVETGEDAQETPDKPIAGTITGTDIGGRVTAWYLTLDSDEYSAFRNGVRLDEDGNVESFVLCDFEGNELTITEVEPERTEFSVTWRGVDYDCAVSWCVRDGQALVRGEGSVPGTDAAWSFDAIPGRSDAALLYVSQGSQLVYRRYPYLCDLETGEITDVLAGTGVNELEFPYQYIFSDSMNRLFVTTHEPRRTYYCDIARGLLIPLDELVDRDALWGVFIDEGTAVITNSTPSETYSAWVLDLDTLAHRQTLSDAPANNGPGNAGTELLGGRYCIYTSQTGASTVIDLVTGEDKPIEGFVNRGRFLANGSRLLYLYADEDAEGLSIASLGVIDMSTGVLTAFDRSGYEDMEGVSVRWLDDERIMLESVSEDRKLLYLCIYELK